MLGLFLSIPSLVQVGVILFAGIVLFQIVTLPVEFNASKRALVNLEGFNMLSNEEMVGAKKMLRAAAFTYVAATLVAISQLLRLLALSNRRR
jgi:Zn-dependent membrane protease YugP